MRSIVYTAANQIDLLHCGAEYYPALIEAFDQAETEIYLETYIFAFDPTGEEIVDALQRAAKRGVVVNVITDWVGTGHAVSMQLHDKLEQNGVRHRSFNPWFRGGVARTHRKICVVDRKLAFLGGLNINDDYISDTGPPVPLPAPRWDFALRINGPLVAAIHREVETQWARLIGIGFKSRWARFKKSRATQITHDHAPIQAALVVRDNLRNRSTIQRAYLHALGHARKTAMLANPYFAPGRKLRDALAKAAARGVDVTLLVGVGEYKLQDAVAHSFYPKLLKSGVKLVEYRKTQLHAKVAVVDGEWATVGSSNYDGLSLFVNQEANVVINDKGFAAGLQRRIEQGVAEGVPVNPEDFTNIPWYRRFWYGTAYLLYKGILRIATLGRYTE
jgi:cardiolipin synthase